MPVRRSGQRRTYWCSERGHEIRCCGGEGCRKIGWDINRWFAIAKAKQSNLSASSAWMSLHHSWGCAHLTPRCHGTVKRSEPHIVFGIDPGPWREGVRTRHEQSTESNWRASVRLVTSRKGSGKSRNTLCSYMHYPVKLRCSTRWFICLFICLYWAVCTQLFSLTNPRRSVGITPCYPRGGLCRSLLVNSGPLFVATIQLDIGCPI